MSGSCVPTTSEFFSLEALIRSTASTADVLRLDGILSDTELEEGERVARAQGCIENLVEGAGK